MQRREDAPSRTGFTNKKFINSPAYVTRYMHGINANKIRDQIDALYNKRRGLPPDQQEPLSIQIIRKQIELQAAQDVLEADRREDYNKKSEIKARVGKDRIARGRRGQREDEGFYDDDEDEELFVTGNPTRAN